jgi:hypothetical protein
MSTDSSVHLSRRRRVLVRVAILGVSGLLAAGGLFVVAVVPPTEYSYYPKCQFHTLTGLHCPGCGLTRALHAALNGQFEQALAYNVFAPVLIPVLGLAVGRALWQWAWGEDDDKPPRRRRGPRWERWAPWACLAVILVFWVLRNLPVYPFTWLAPHELGQ